MNWGVQPQPPDNSNLVYRLHRLMIVPNLYLLFNFKTPSGLYVPRVKRGA